MPPRKLAVFIPVLVIGIILTKYFKFEKLAARNSAISSAVRDSQIVIYNRIPKTGSTTFASFCNKQAEKNEFWSINLNASLPNGKFTNAYIWPLSEQRKFVLNITELGGFYKKYSIQKRAGR